MLLSWTLFLVANIISIRSGGQDGQGGPSLIIGVSNPAALLAFTPIPVGDNSSFSNSNVLLSTSNVQITSLASDPNKGVVFMAMLDTIYMIFNYTISESNFFMIPVLKGKSSALGQIAVDYISNNLYWCDPLHQWIAIKPAYNNNNDIYKVLIHKDLRQPEGLALDPHKRLMFFSDNGPTPRIEKAYLDGQDREVIVYAGLSRVLSLSVDVQNNILYWVDNMRHTIEASNYDGSNRRVIRRINGIQFTGLFYFQKENMRTLEERTLASTVNGKGLIFDWIANLLGWIQAQSTVISYSINSGTTEIIYSNLHKLTSLTVDSQNGVLYWISAKTGSMSIERGTWTRETLRVVISATNLNKPYSLQFDVTSQRLFWLDRLHLKSSSTDGSDIKSHVNTMGATDAFVFKGFFGWINGDKIYFTRQSSDTVDYVSETVQNPKSVAVFDAILQQDKRDTCQILNGGCEDICIPVTNGRRCECDIGLKLQADNTCDSDALVTNFIMVTDYSHGRLLQISLQNGSIVKLPIAATTNEIALDQTTQTLFYTDKQKKTIMSTTLYETQSSLIHKTGSAHVNRLAIDYSTGNLYYTAEGFIGTIHRSLMLHKTVLSNLLFPTEIILCPSQGFLFWVEFGNTAQISRANMDGTARICIATTNLGLPTGLAIDFALNRLYWTDGYLNHIEVSDLNGCNRRVLATDTDADLMSIGIHGQYLYYTALNRQRITKMDKTTGSIVSFMSDQPELGRLGSLDIHTDGRRDVSVSCSNKNGRCSTFCFPTPSGRTCGCQDSVNLQSDNLTCGGVLQCPSSLENAVLSSDCLRRSGDSCSFSCAQGYIPSTTNKLVCTNKGIWNQDTAKLCSSRKEDEVHSGNTMYMYMLGAALGIGALVIVMFFLQYRGP
uniref:Low-density lipoprotein receptor-related protein 6-like isoform X3 n=1 Tax=Crassostrea virginica TaxID=6565 RepID=A0A8B8DER8_CRAVI|nr:low-density lipoprotein receptor-related protein 6-like isoform X3 [Crassostrea virginica]